ncbi:MAG: S8 family serine peptidase [Planctomycetes bacterium]|nr:S8 family serine peptidase [Planctomycetota bacterium]
MRAGSRGRTGLVLTIGFGLSYLALAPWLPSHDAPGAAATQAAATAAATEDDHGAPGHVCGLDAKLMLQRFQEAIRERGAVHPTYDYAGGGATALAVRGQVAVGLAGLASAADVEALAARYGAQVVRHLPSMAQALLGCDGEVRDLVDALGADPLVRWAEPNIAARVTLTPNDPFLPLQRGVRSAQAERAWDLTTGGGVIVAVLDTGIDPDHPDLRARLVPGYDFVNQTATLSDDNGHGTAMAGIIAAEGDNGEGVVGVAYGARVLPIKVADAMGVASVADVAAGIDLAIQRGARVINLSMGTPVGSQALLDAVNRALNAGVVVVASAGNDPVHHTMFPAAYPGVVSVTVLGPDGELGYEAAISDRVDVGAPGEEMVTTLPGGVYGFVAGSSASAAFASGVAALVAARDPTLSGAQVAQVLRHAQTPVAALADVEHVYRFGRLDARLAVERAAAGLVDVAVSGLRVSPTQPVPGGAAVAWVEVTNKGNVAANNVIVRVERVDASGAVVEVGVGAVPALAPGERRELRLTFTAPAAGVPRFIATITPLPGETLTADNTRDLLVRVAPTPEVDVRVIGRTLTTPDLASGQVTFGVVLENVGGTTVNQVAVDASIVEVRASTAPAATPIALPRQVIPTLAPAGRATLQFTWTLPAQPPAGILRFEARVAGSPGEARLSDNTLVTDFSLGAHGALQPLYQQSNGVDLIPDAPWRVDPQRPYVPVQVFVPSKGGRTPATRLRVTRTEVLVRDTPTGPGTTVYDDAWGMRPAVAPQGLVIVDELGTPRPGATAQDLFGDVELDMNGRHDVLRLPRDVLGVPLSPTALTDKFVDVKVSWQQRRTLLFGLTSTRSGSHRAVMRVRFSPTSLPSLPGENHYHDVHHHTIAEWYFGSPLDLFAPRKAYGGPLQMVFESAYAMGVISAPTQQAAWGRIITTDHNSFNNRTIPDPDGPDHRPPFGPQSPARNPGVGQLEAFRNVLGPSAGEEVAFKQDIPIPKINIPFVNQLVNQLANLLPGVPLGAHMLLYHADHVEGPWHGGGWLVGPGNPNINVDLFPLLNDVAKNRQARQGKAFTYAAHPFSGQGWRDENLDRAYGLDPARRTRDEVHDQTNKFVVKGVEFFNGRGTRSLPTSQIDFNDLNPWANQTFSRGESGWDKGLWVGMTEWHRMMAKTLEYAFTSEPDTRFVRKIYQAGGSDAHGDFNFSVGRAATPLSIQMTYNVGDEAYYGVRTYCFAEGKTGATLEDRWMLAYADGNCVTTDGPLLELSLDADRRFDSGDRRWHDATLVADDEDGRMGGDGALDGGFTALVRRGSDAPAFRYRYSTSPEWGPIRVIHLYKTEAGAPNPTRRRGLVDQLVGVNQLALGGADQDLVQALDPSREGPVTKITAFMAGAYTGADPDQGDLGPDDYRCWTNPVFVVPYDVDVDVTAVDAATGTIPAGALEVRWTFDISMDPTARDVEVKALDAQGESTDLSVPALTRLVPRAGSGWSDRPGIRSSVLTLTNQDPIPLGGDAYPTPGTVSFAVYWRDPPRDAAGNALNPIATTFEATQMGGGRGTTAAPLTAGGRSGGRSGGGSGPCALSAPSAPGSPLGAGLLVVVAALVVLRRRAARG